MTTVLGIDVDRELLDRWAGWLAPDRQPFWGGEGLLAATGADVVTGDPGVAVSGTYGLYGEDGAAPRVELTEEEFLALPRSLRGRLVRAQVGAERESVPSVRAWMWLLGTELRQQADGHRFVWWRSMLAGREEDVLSQVVTEGWEPQPVSRHREVPDLVWHEALAVLPRARELAGTFPRAPGANCFATVLAAAGAGPVEDWVVREPTEEFLAARTRRGGRDDQPGTVLVWRSAEGRQVEHAAVTLGGGWALHKANQCWWSPRTVLPVRDVIRASRVVGRRLERRHLV